MILMAGLYSTADTSIDIGPPETDNYYKFYNMKKLRYEGFESIIFTSLLSISFWIEESSRCLMFRIGSFTQLQSTLTLTW